MGACGPATAAAGDTKEREKNSVGVSSVNRRPAADIGSGERRPVRELCGDRWPDTFLGVDLFVCETDEKVSIHSTPTFFRLGDFRSTVLCFGNSLASDLMCRCDLRVAHLDLTPEMRRS